MQNNESFQVFNFNFEFYTVFNHFHGFTATIQDTMHYSHTLYTGTWSSWLNISNSLVQVSTFASKVDFSSFSSFTISWNRCWRWYSTVSVLSFFWSSWRPISVHILCSVSIEFWMHWYTSFFIICMLSSTAEVERWRLWFFEELKKKKNLDAMDYMLSTIKPAICLFVEWKINSQRSSENSK